MSLETSFSEERAILISKIETMRLDSIEGERKEAELHAHLEKSLSEIDALSSRVKKSESQCHDVNAKIRSLEQEKEASQQLRLENESLIRVLEDKIKVTEQLNDEAKLRVSKLEVQMVELKDVCNRKNDELNQLSVSLKVLKEELERSRVEKDRVSEQLLHTSQVLLDERRERESLRLRLEAFDAKLVELEVPKTYQIDSPAFSEDFGPISPPLSPPSSTRVRRSAGREWGGTVDSLPSVKETDTALLEENEALKGIIKQVTSYTGLQVNLIVYACR